MTEFNNGVTVSELIEILQEYNGDMEVILPQCEWEDGEEHMWNAHITFVETGKGFEGKKSVIIY